VIDVPHDDAVLEAIRELNIYYLFPRASVSSDASEFWRTKQYIPHIRIMTIKITRISVGNISCTCVSQDGFFIIIILQESACEVVE